jgi:hypothetical protein
MTDYRIEREGARLDYTCENRRYYTNTGLGEMHTPHSSRGSVLPEPLVRNPNGSLWLEHVSDRKEAGANYYWFMWYDPNGWPTIPASSIFAREDMV